MEQFEMEIFPQTSDYSEIRLSHGDALRTRGLDGKAIDDLIEVVGRIYAEDSMAQRVFGAAQLRELGKQLYHFLDGDERWLGEVAGDPRGVVLRISAEARLRHLPWELVVKDDVHLAVNERTPLLPIRACSAIAAVAAEAKAQNRPLRVLFMAASPEGVEPVLSYEAEESGILTATADTGTDLVVEESGTLEGLRFTAESYGAGYFDVLHLSGHATIQDGQPKFLIENELGGPVLASADEIARAMVGQWPRVVFVSGCLTGGAAGNGTIPSMSESLVNSGAPVVLGWALPVGDVSATMFATYLYRALAAGQRLDLSVVRARQQLYGEQSRSWHLLRVYADKSPLTPMVTPLNTPGRGRIRVRHAADEFLDPQTQISRVASRTNFVGRRRVIQRCLRTLKQPLGTPGAAQALVLQGMGGLGKSTLASRLLERMPTHQRAVWFGRVDLTKFRELTSKVRFQSLDQQIEAAAVLAKDEVDLYTRLTYLFDGPLGQVPCLLVFDDFEQGNLEERDGGHVLSPEMAKILPALLKAIDETNSPSRVIITSRYQFPAPPGVTLRVEALETFTDVEQVKKVANLPNLRPESVIPTAVKERAVAAASGNPRLLDWLDRILPDATLDVDALMAAIENEADRFRKENIFAQKLLGTQPMELQKMLARLNVVELPIPSATVFAIQDHPEAQTHVRRAVQLGLLEEGTDPETNEPRYFVSNVLRPLIRPLITDDEYREACAAAARSLYQIWVTAEPAVDAEPEP
ncbi:CHAT domain-containing protein [Actinoplanes sp. NPDC049668]|uniref:CHAT domain-containing protein n=1 Tax=unclassified Actinoplanes TaxID=2626549 RepID=UPI0033BA1589